MGFKLVALLFLVTNGVPADKPSGKYTSDDTFTSEDACKRYLAENGEKTTRDINATLRAHVHAQAKPQFSCVQVEDNTI